MASNPDLHYLAESVTFDANHGRATVVMNNQRVQCEWCEKFFATQAMLDKHNEDFPSGCSVHSQCFGKGDNLVHATRKVHERCFVLGCKSKFRTEEGWENSAIVEHVKEEHSYY